MNEEDRLLEVIANFIKSCEPPIMLNVKSLQIEGWTFNNLSIIYLTEVSCNGIKTAIDPTYFVEFKRYDKQYQFEIKP